MTGFPKTQWVKCPFNVGEVNITQHCRVIRQ